MIEIELDAHIRPSDLANDSGGMLGPGEKIVRPVARIDRLDQQRDVLLRVTHRTVLLGSGGKHRLDLKPVFESMEIAGGWFP